MFTRTKSFGALPADRLRRAAPIALVALWVSVGDGMAAEQRYETYAGSPVVASEQLRAMRGGLRIAGLDIAFGATVRTILNGSPAAETVFTLNDAGGMDRRTTVMNGAALTPVSGGAIADGKLDPPALAGAQGFLVKDASGVSAALADVTLQHARNVVVNTAPGRDLRQTVDMSLAIQNFAQVRSGLQAGALADRIAHMGQVQPMLSTMH